jgi:hypothetical protein
LVGGEVLPADEGEAAAGAGRPAQVGERGDRVVEEHDPEPGDDRVERSIAEGVDLGVGLLERGVREPGRASVGACPGQHRRGQVDPEHRARRMSRLHRLDPEPLRHRLGDDIPIASTVEGLLDHLRSASEEQQRPDLAGAARWLAGHPPPPAPEVICHGDLHPFNLLVDSDGAVTVLDWSAALLGPRAYDVAFAALTLAEPPITGPQARQHAGTAHPDHGQLGAQEKHAKSRNPQHASSDQGGCAHSRAAIRGGAPPRPFDVRKAAGAPGPPERYAPPGASPAVW